jgi:hypothetical protein
MDKEAIVSIVKDEFRKHTWDTFVDEPPSVAEGGRGVVVPGCPQCHKRIQTIGQFVDHLSEHVSARVLGSC